MAPNFKTHTLLLSVLGKLTINANESQSGDYLTSATYRPRERASETMGHERHETKDPSGGPSGTAGCGTGSAKGGRCGHLM